MVCSTSLAPNSQSTPPWCLLSTRTDEQHEEQRPLQGSHCAEQTYPELHGAGGRARLVVLAAEVGGSGPTKLPSSLVN